MFAKQPKAPLGKVTLEPFRFKTRLVAQIFHVWQLYTNFMVVMQWFYSGYIVVLPLQPFPLQVALEEHAF